MADVKMCDGCGKTSPDTSGRYLHQNWFSVKVGRFEPMLFFFGRQEHEFLLCENCMGQDDDRSPVKRWLDRLIDPIAKVFRRRDESETVASETPE